MRLLLLAQQPLQGMQGMLAIGYHHRAAMLEVMPRAQQRVAHRSQLARIPALAVQGLQQILHSVLQRLLALGR